MATTTPVPVQVKPLEVLLPPQTDIHIRAYVNAAYNQRITLQLVPGATPIVFTGNGDHDREIGEYKWTTPGASNPVVAKVMIENDGGTGIFRPSKMMKIGCNLQTFNLAAVLSEDAGDQDYNDGVVEFTWWTKM